MAIRTYKVTLDTKNAIAPEPVYLRQGDKTGAVVIDATLTDNGSPVSLSGLTPSFMANTADGKAFISDTTGFAIVDASGGEFTYQVPSQLGSVDGKIQIAYFSFSDSSGAQSTFNVVFVVEKAADMTQESAKDWASNLNEIIDQYNQWVNDAHSSWEDFVNANKKILESIDPGGDILAELISARNSPIYGSFLSLSDRLTNSETLIQNNTPNSDTVTIPHNMNAIPSIKVYKYDYGLGLFSFGNEPNGFGNTILTSIPASFVYPDTNTVIIKMPKNTLPASYPVLCEDGNYRIFDGVHVIKFDFDGGSKNGGVGTNNTIPSANTGVPSAPTITGVTNNDGKNNINWEANK